MTKADSPDDSILKAEVERAVAPYRRILPPEAVAAMSEALEHILLTHPVGAALLDRVRPQAAPDRSGTKVKETTTRSAAKKKKGAK